MRMQFKTHTPLGVNAEMVWQDYRVISVSMTFVHSDWENQVLTHTTL